MNGRNLAAAICAAALVFSAAAKEAAFESETGEFDRWYAGGAGSLVLPQNGLRFGRLGGGVARVGYYLSESLAVEAEAGALENKAAIGLRGLWHWWGYERIDPFFTFGARGILTHGTLGPEAGIGTFYHLDDRWSLRFEASSILAVEGETGVVYALSAGFQRSF